MDGWMDASVHTVQNIYVPLFVKFFSPVGVDGWKDGWMGDRVGIFSPEY